MSTILITGNLEIQRHKGKEYEMCLYAVRQSWDHNGSATGCIAMATIPKVTFLHIWRKTSDLAHFFSLQTDGAQWWSHFTRPGIEWCRPSRPLPIFDTLSTNCVWLWSAQDKMMLRTWNCINMDLCSETYLRKTNPCGIQIWSLSEPGYKYLEIFRLFQFSLKLL